LSESDGIAAGYPGLMDSSLTDISLDIDNKNDPGKKHGYSKRIAQVIMRLPEKDAR